MVQTAAAPAPPGLPLLPDAKAVGTPAHFAAAASQFAAWLRQGLSPGRPQVPVRRGGGRYPGLPNTRASRTCVGTTPHQHQVPLSVGTHARYHQTHRGGAAACVTHLVGSVQDCDSIQQVGGVAVVGLEDAQELFHSVSSWPKGDALARSCMVCYHVLVVTLATAAGVPLSYLWVHAVVVKPHVLQEPQLLNVVAQLLLQRLSRPQVQPVLDSACQDSCPVHHLWSAHRHQQ